MKKISTSIVFFLLITAIISLIFTSGGCIRKSEEIIIGASFPLTGEVASYGQRAKRGIEIAVEEINMEGGVNGRRIKVIFEDDRNDPKTGVSIIRKFATVDKLSVVLGSAGSTVSLAMTPVANQNEVVLLSPISSSVKLTSEGGPYFFRVCPADDAQAKILAQWVLEKGYKRVAVVYTNNSWGKPLANGFKYYYEKEGGKVEISEAVEEKSSDLRSILAKIKSAQIDAIVSPTYPVEGGNLLKQAKELGFKAEFFGGDNWDAPEFLTVAGEAANGALFVDPSEPEGEKFQAFADKYRSKFGEEPDINAAFSYDALYTLAKAFNISEGLNGPSIQRALHKMLFAGITGIIEFDENGDLKTPAFDKNRILNGKKVKIEE